ncbi:hypothetical protein COU76_02960 [Candidatus Peregrinibacteria bacterium CG10_big_fil_rev_8_21_14_0_10_49_10]|nr:MAG: hypothetical protein COU76_02960 [Candidatus Peregrinibacteria bacterium CG10_big_fil_rev_8_21_14_0_10_49_10]
MDAQKGCFHAQYEHMFRKVSSTASALFATVLLIPTALAQNSLITSGISGCDFGTGKITKECAPAFLAHVLQFMFAITGAYFVIMIVIGGYQIAIAKAVGRDRSEGFTRIRVAIGGFILCAFSWAIIDFIIAALTGGGGLS